MSWQTISENITDSCIGAFSESIKVHYFDKDSNTFEIEQNNGVYDSDYKQVDLQSGSIISSNSPMVEISIRSLQRALNKSDKIEARGVIFKIREIQPDASGAVKYILIRS